MSPPLTAVDVELSKKKDPPFSNEVVEALITLCKLSILDQVFEDMKSTNALLRKKIEKMKIEDFNTALLVQLSTGNIAMKFTKTLAGEIGSECKSREIDEKKFMEQAFPYLSGDINIIFELENYFGLKVREESGLKEVDLELAKKFYNQTVDYSKMLIEGRIMPQSAMIFPSMMGHFLYNKFGVYTSQMAEFAKKYFSGDADKFDENFLRLMFKEIYFSERARKVIFQMVQMQMEMMSQLMGLQGGMDPSMMGMPPPGMDPAMMGGPPPGMPTNGECL